MRKVIHLHHNKISRWAFFDDPAYDTDDSAESSNILTHAPATDLAANSLWRQDEEFYSDGNSNSGHNFCDGGINFYNDYDVSFSCNDGNLYCDDGRFYNGGTHNFHGKNGKFYYCCAQNFLQRWHKISYAGGDKVYYDRDFHDVNKYIHSGDYENVHGDSRQQVNDGGNVDFHNRA